MRRVDLSEWTPEQVDAFIALFRVYKEEDDLLALTPDQRDIAEQLGLIPPLTVMVEVRVGDKIYRGILGLHNEDGVYRGAVHE